jgi:hypothetical protein
MVKTGVIYIHTKNPYVGLLGRAFESKMLVDFMSIWYVLQPLVYILYTQLAYFVVIWYLSLHFGMLY